MTYQQCAPMTLLFLLFFIFFGLELRALGILVKVEGGICNITLICIWNHSM